MKSEDVNSLRLEIYTLWYHAKDKKKKATYKKTLDLIDHVSELKSSLKSVRTLFSGLL
mgnify:CR=1 FL=1|jgi:hypothetical protein